MENTVLLSTTSEKSKIKNPWILGNNEIQYLIVLYFPFLSLQKINEPTSVPVELKKKFRRAAGDPEHASTLFVSFLPLDINKIGVKYCTVRYSEYGSTGIDMRLWVFLYGYRGDSVLDSTNPPGN